MDSVFSRLLTGAAIVVAIALQLSAGASAQEAGDVSAGGPGLVVEVQKSELAPAPTAGGATVPAEESLQIVGVLTASHMYTTFGYIGVTADALSKKVYPAERVRELMTEVSAMCDNVIAQMGRLDRKKLSEDDGKAIDEMISIYRQLKVQAEALKTYAGQRTDKNAAEFDTARKTVWPRIEKLLGLSGEK